MPDPIRSTIAGLQLREAAASREEREQARQAADTKAHHAGTAFIAEHYGPATAAALHHHALGIGHALHDPEADNTLTRKHLKKHLDHVAHAEQGAPALPHGVHVSHFTEHGGQGHAGHIEVNHSHLPRVSVYGARHTFGGEKVEHAHMSLSSGKIHGPDDAKTHHAIIAYAAHHMSRMSAPVKGD